MAGKVGQIVGYYSAVPANQLVSGVSGPWPGIIEYIDPDGRARVWVFHRAAVVVVPHAGDVTLGSPPTSDYWTEM